MIFFVRFRLRDEALKTPSRGKAKVTAAAAAVEESKIEMKTNNNTIQSNKHTYQIYLITSLQHKINV